jgi:hypothetical protein
MDNPSSRETGPEPAPPRLRALLERSRQAELEVPPYVVTRAMARFRERRSERRLRFWKWLAILGPVTAASAAAVILLAILPAGQLRPIEPSYAALAGQDVTLRIDIAASERGRLTYAEVELPNGVQFVSERHPEIREQRRLKFAVSDSFFVSNPASIPFVIHSKSAGLKEVRVRFLDQDQVTVKERVLRIRFKEMPS